ncbi:MAG TPA: FecR domain-containing protein [Pedobacter sp.]|uniref:FecR family protein n=1 Tax=Pedobacter sp. TaxID=1411316 RepID=UPI002CED6B54|nr:FecR domain-containing protein [Pedobacter sp.]HMI01688.1 FecR domain-containing protein [Pedobacter sp.]
MSQQDAKSLIEKYQSGLCSPEEKAIVENWLTFGEATDLDLSEAELNADLTELRQRVIGTDRKTVKLWPKIAVAASRSKFGTSLIAAAAVAVVVFGAGLFYFGGDNRLEPVKTAVANDIAPGKNGATITLANGKMIQLSDAKSGVVVGKDLKYDDGTALSGLQPSLPGGERSMALTASTAKGQTYQFTLPDGTKVWLNADSKLEFPSNFVNSKTRNVKLSGEGYFEVAKDKTHPFMVATDKQEVEVLGTHFNINAYKDEDNTKTTLLEGSVRVYNLPEPGKDYETLADRMVLLKPNQQSVLAGSNRLAVTDIDPEAAVAWKNNKFMFDSQSITDIMRMVSRWYNVEVIYTGELPTDKFWGSVSRFDNVSKVLKALESTNNVHFKIEGRRIYVSR